MKFSSQAINLIKRYEGLKLSPCLCPAGKKTIGYGHVLLENTAVNSRIKKILNFPISKEFAEEILKDDLNLVEEIIKKDVKVKLTQGQFDALISLIYNWGGENFKKSIGLKQLNADKFTEAKIEFFSKEKGVVKVKGVIFPGLVARRQAELELFNA